MSDRTIGLGNRSNLETPRKQKTNLHVLVLAYGNPLRGDDGLAWRAAHELKKAIVSPNIEIEQLPQLVPEFAEVIGRSKAVIFLDAATPQPGKTNPGEFFLREVLRQGVGQSVDSAFGHQCSPESLLRLAEELYQAQPRAFIATLTGKDFGSGEKLSPAVELAIPEFVARLEKLIRELVD